MRVQKGLTAYAIGISAALAFVVITGAAKPKAELEEITVKRINVLEPDGTLRLVISGAQEAPGINFHNKEYPHTSGGRPAGMYFMNDEGTEAGGIIFSGKEQEDGRPFSLVQFSMDNYDQDQALVLRHIQDQGIVTGMIVNDVPLVPKDPARLAPLATLEGEARQKLLDELRATGMFDSKMRMFAGRGRSGDAMLSLHDAEGRPRLFFRVTEEGEVDIQVLDEDGEMVKNLVK